MSLGKSNNDWEWVKAKDFMLFNPRESVKKGTVVKNVPMDKIEPKTKEIPSYELTEYKGGVKFRNGDTLMARITPCLENGKISQVSILDYNEIGAGSTEFIVLREKEGVSDKDFIYYLSNSEYFKEPAIKSMVGSSGRQRVQRDVVENLDIFVPPLDTQKKIGKLLSLFDKKITLNKKINKNLESIAQSVLNEKFFIFSNYGAEKLIDTDIGKIPEDWKIYSLKELFDHIKPGTNYQPKRIENGIPFLNVKNVNSGFIDLSDVKYISTEDYNKVHKTWIPEDGDILISRIGTLGLTTIINKEDLPLAVHYNFINVKSKKIPYQFVYFLFKSKNFQRKYHTIKKYSVQEYVTIDDFSEIEIALPIDLNEFKQEFELFINIFNKIQENISENKKLQKLRDTLLPKLMSGEIDVSKINCDLE